MIAALPRPAETRASATRLLAESLAGAATGPGAGLATALAILIGRHARFDAADPFWADRDRLVADPSLGGLCATLAGLLGAEIVALHRPALGIGVGLAMAERLMTQRFGRSLVDHSTWVLCRGSDLATGAMQEAAWAAGAWRLGRLTLLAEVDDEAAPGLAGFAANGWSVRRVASDQGDEIGAALSACLRSLKPTLLACVGGFPQPPGGENQPPGGESQPPGGADPTPGGWDPSGAQAAWSQAGRKGEGARRAWLKRLARHAARAEFDNALAGRLAQQRHAALSDPAGLLPARDTSPSTARTLRASAEALAGSLPEVVLMPGRSRWPVSPTLGDPLVAAQAGRLAQAMSGMSTGLALHGGLLPISAQHLGRTADLLPGLQGAARVQARLIQILTEPEASPVDTGERAALRALDNLLVFRPADATEALECLDLAVRHTQGPSVILASTRPMPLLAERPSRTRSTRGGYLVARTEGPRAGTLLACGADLAVALAARGLLASAGRALAVVSLPCWELFGETDEGWRTHVLGSAPRIAIDSGGGFGWERWLGTGGLFIALFADRDAFADRGPQGGEAAAARVAEMTMRHLIGTGLPRQTNTRPGHAVTLSTQASQHGAGPSDQRRGGPGAKPVRTRGEA